MFAFVFLFFQTQPHSEAQLVLLGLVWLLLTGPQVWSSNVWQRGVRLRARDVVRVLEVVSEVRWQ